MIHIELVFLQTLVAVATILARDSNPQDPPRSINYAIGSCKQILFLCNYFYAIIEVIKLSLHFVPVSPAIGDVMFNISRTSGVLTVSGNLDRETVSRFIISVMVYTFRCLYVFFNF